MPINPAIISSASALLGALAGGGASFAAALYTQRSQDRIQRINVELAKRELVYSDFVMSASRAFLATRMQDTPSLGADEQHLAGLLNRMRLFAPLTIVKHAEQVIHSIARAALEPALDIRSLIDAEISGKPTDAILAPFSVACRADLDLVSRTLKFRNMAESETP